MFKDLTHSFLRYNVTAHAAGASYCCVYGNNVILVNKQVMDSINGL